MNMPGLQQQGVKPRWFWTLYLLYLVYVFEVAYIYISQISVDELVSQQNT